MTAGADRRLSGRLSRHRWRRGPPHELAVGRLVRRAIWGKPTMGNDRRTEKTSVKGAAEGLRRPLQVERTGEIVPGLAAMPRRHLGQSKITRMSAEVIRFTQNSYAACSGGRSPVRRHETDARWVKSGPERRYRWLRILAINLLGNIRSAARSRTKDGVWRTIKGLQGRLRCSPITKHGFQDSGFRDVAEPATTFPRTGDQSRGSTDRAVVPVAAVLRSMKPQVAFFLRDTSARTLQ